MKGISDPRIVEVLQTDLRFGLRKEKVLGKPNMNAGEIWMRKSIVGMPPPERH
jgi:hypothetical protein